MADTTRPATEANSTAGDTAQDPIHFDTLWSTAQDALTVYAAKRWSARGDADPGVTLLQALTFAVSDVSYRHTLPLADLLTPESVLTCGPVTLNDYRRLLLDLTDTNNESLTLLFRDVQIATVSPAQSYAYIYVWATLNPGVKEDDAKKRLQTCLRDNRNLCEWEITDICLLTPKTEAPRVVIELDDDLPTEQPAQVVAQAIWQANDALLPWPTRQCAAARLAQGKAAEVVYAGPLLEHGWIADLPPSRETDKDGKLAARSVQLSTLTAAMVIVRGIKRVLWDSPNGQASEGTLEIAANAQLQLWVDPASGLLEGSALDSQIIVRKRGQTIKVKAEAINKHLKALLTQVTLAKRDETRRVPYGQYRHPGYYRSAGSWLPPVYGLQQTADQFAKDFNAKQLLRFLRPFEQQVADSADQLEKLPRLLAFDGRDAAVWGAADWPKASEDALAVEQSARALTERATLKQESERHSQDNDKELAIINYLLSYFGECRAPRTLLETSKEEFHQVQQGFLRQVTRLSYERAAISISKISALQRKLAARLGIGKELFDETLQQDGAQFPSKPLPFYLIEHQELLPITPDPALVGMDWKTVTYKDEQDNREKQGRHLLILTLEGVTNGQLCPGQLIELQPRQDKNAFEQITGIVIHRVEPNGHDANLESNVRNKKLTIKIDLDQHQRLRNSVPLLRENPDYKWYWRISSIWLKRVVYDLCYSVKPNYNDECATLKVRPSFPMNLKTGSQFELRPKVRWQVESTKGDEGKGYSSIVAQVKDIDPIQGTMTIQWIGKSDSLAWPDDKLSALYGWSVPYEEDAFAFTLSVVLNRSWLRDRGNPSELNQWIEKIVREEAPSHLNIQLHWLDEEHWLDEKTFASNFSHTYQLWQKDGRPVGDQSYRLLNLLGMGDRPTDERTGIGFVQIADPQTRTELENDILKGDKDASRQARLRQQVVYVEGSNTPLPPLRQLT